MNIEEMEKLEMILAMGTMFIVVIFYVILAVICFVVSSKKKQTNPKDAKTWKTLGIILVCTGVLAILGAAAAFVIPAILSEMAILII